MFAALLAACARPPAAGAPLDRRGDEISVCGRLFHTGARVVLWNDAGGYDAYRVQARFAPEDTTGATPAGARYGPERDALPPDIAERVRRAGWQLADLQQVVRLLVLHYDAAGTARQCFKILHDVRGLSAHFLIDLDGTIYQTLDLKERAWHAGTANDASIGVELANVGAYASPDAGTLRDWYRSGPDGTRISFPDYIEDPGLRTAGFEARPARDELVSGAIHGTTYYQYDFTAAQYDALQQLTAALVALFPRLPRRAPVDAAGSVRTTVLSEAELAEFAGILGHWHVAADKIDPGPAFDWGRLLSPAPKD